MSKTYKNLYPRIYDFENIYQAYIKARKGKRYQSDVLKFSANLEENLITIQNELIWHQYQCGEYHHFKVFEPKQRDVAALPFRDRVVHHAIINIIEPIFEQRFIYDSYACRVGKGTHAGADRAQKFMRIVKRNHGRVYALKADVSKYFASIDHEVLTKLLNKRIACAETMSLIKVILGSTQNPGIPIGNLTSQLFANIYLHELDEYCKYTLRERFYVRYMDDFVILHHDKQHLHKIREQIEWFLATELKLKTNHKTQVFPIAGARGRSLDFLGYKIWPTHRKLRKDSIKRFKKRLKKMQRQYADGTKTLPEIRQRIMTFIAHAGHANSAKTISKTLGKAIFIKNTKHSQK